jgi:hypothetical protein
MNRVFGRKALTLVIVIVFGILITAGCTSESAPDETGTPPTTQGTVTREPLIYVMDFNPMVEKGNDVVFTGNAFGGAKSLVITIYYVCEMEASNCPNPASLYKMADFIEKKEVTINEDASFSSKIPTSEYRSGMYVAFLELPTGQYSSCAFTIIA